MTDGKPDQIFLKDYQPPRFLIPRTALHFELGDDETVVTASLNIERQGSHSDPLNLHGQDLELLSLEVDGEPLSPSSFELTASGLSIPDVPDKFCLRSKVRIKPHLNTSLEGLYRSRTLYCTQCEAEGFRKITFFLDRPDVLSVFTTTVRADAARFPVLLSNGNPVDAGTHPDGSHWLTWHDPFPKPAYLFALVGGDLSRVTDSFTTVSGRDVAIHIYVEEKDLDKCAHAVDALKNAMRWDEEVYGREYDLDIYMIVAVDDFNMGAMENKGLNIFNTSCVLANPATTTDAGFQRVEAVVAHEYFHNWSGNRVTCRDWFQLSLKEGFTVFRDAEFSADMGSRTVKRIEDVQLLRTAQFAEDAGPMAHPVQPPSFIEISNFYTLTIYEKGAEVVRMIHTLLGPELFRKGADLYFHRHDGQAVTIEDFIDAMATVSGRDFSQFMLWYRQAGTPTLSVTGHYDAGSHRYTLHIKQECPDTPEATAQEKQPFLVPVAMGLVGKAGPLPLCLEPQANGDGTASNTVLELTENEQTFCFHNVFEKPVPALLRNFSAPVKLVFDYSPEDLNRLMRNEDDGYCRWDAAQQLAMLTIKSVMQGSGDALLEQLLAGYDALLRDESLDEAMVAMMLDLPAESYIGDQFTQVDVEAIHLARQSVKAKMAEALRSGFMAAYKRSRAALNGSTAVDAKSVALRSLQNRALNYLMQLDDPQVHSICLSQFYDGSNMTEVLGALTAIVHSQHAAIAQGKEEALRQFFDKWQHESLVVNQWLSVQASDPDRMTLKKVKALMLSPAFDIKNPNKIRSLIGVFSNQNLVNFHDATGDGYAFLADQIITLNRLNPQIASRLVTPLSKWRRYDECRQSLMKRELQRIVDSGHLSNDVYEMVNRSL